MPYPILPNTHLNLLETVFIPQRLNGINSLNDHYELCYRTLNCIVDKLEHPLHRSFVWCSLGGMINSCIDPNTGQGMAEWWRGGFSGP